MAQTSVSGSGWGAGVNGYRSSIDGLRAMRQGWIGGHTRWIVGVGAEYGAYVEFGTSRMKAQPYLFPAARNAVREDLPAILNKSGRAMKPMAYIVSHLALSIERRAKQNAPVDTGFLRSSIRAVPAEALT